MQLRPYDIILQKGHKGIVSSLIRKITKAGYNHSAIYMGNLHVIEAAANGVKVNNLNYSLGEFDGFRYYRPLSDEEKDKIETFLMKAVNSKYDFVELFMQLFNRKGGVPKKYICISLLMEAFEDAGLEVGDWKIGFEQVYNSPYFIKINGERP